MGSKFLTGKTALVTGSTSGIGLGIATALADAGANLVLNGFGDVDAALEQVKAIGAAAVHHPADMTRPAEIEAMVSFAVDTYGSLDILVNNAGIQHVAPVQDFPAEKWDAIIAINLSSAFHTTRTALPGMLQHGWGRIINISSAHGLVGSVGKSAYVSAKHGILGLTKVTALENAQTPVTVNAICPGFVLTPLVQAQITANAERNSIGEDAAKAALLGEKQPSGEFVTPEQIAGLALFLCSDAAAQIRGAELKIDGGWTAQ